MLVQILIAVGVIFVLKHKLNRELTEAALEKLHAAAFGTSGPIIVKSHRALSQETQNRMRSMVNRRSARAEVVFEQDRTLKGGIVIDLPGGSIDCSLAGCIKKLWS